MSDLEGDRCVLCLDDKRSPVRIQCGHSFCNECLKVYKSYQKYSWANKCPICRSKLKEKKRTIAKRNSSSANSSLQNQSQTQSTSSGTPNNSLLEQYISIATDSASFSSGQHNTSILSGIEMNITPRLRITGTLSDSDSGDRFYENDDYDFEVDDDDNGNYFSDSDDENYYYFEEDALSWERQTSMEDYEQDVILDPEDAIVLDQEESWVRMGHGGSQPSYSDSDVIILDDVIIVD